ncbi:hypothetical protein [Micromonospora zhanjiangensis]
MTGRTSAGPPAPGRAGVAAVAESIRRPGLAAGAEFVRRSDVVAVAAEPVCRPGRRSPSCIASLARPRAHRLLTVPSATPSISATSATG